MGTRWKYRLHSHPVELGFATIILLSIAFAAIHVFRFGYLPEPFFFETWDTFGDWFNTGFWAREPGAYDTWRSVYLPLSLVLLENIGPDYCYAEFRNGMAARHCDYVSLSVIACLFVFNAFLTWRLMNRFNPATAPMRTVAVAFGYPMLFAVERGNLLIAAFPCLLLALAPALSSARLRWIFAGLAVNFKIYLIAAIVPLLLKGRWLRVEGALLSVALIYLLSLAIYGSGTPMNIYGNIRDFQIEGPNSILDMWYTTTYQPLLLLMERGDFPFVEVIGSTWVELTLQWVPVMVMSTQLLILLAALAIWYRPSAFTTFRAISLGLLMAFVSTEPGGYTLICLLPFVMLERWEGIGPKIAIILCYIMAIPADIAIDTLPEAVRHLYFWDTTTLVQHRLIIGPFVRPLLIILLAWALSIATLVELFRSIVSTNEQEERPKAREAAIS